MNWCRHGWTRHWGSEFSDENGSPLPISADAKARDAIVTEPLTAPLAARALELSVASAGLLRPAPAPEHRHQRDLYRAELARAGLMRGLLKVNQAELGYRLRDHWGALLQRIEGIGLDAAVETWLASLVRTGAGSQPPLQHLLLDGFLRAQPDACSLKPSYRYVERRRPPAQEPRTPATRRASVDWPAIDAAMAADVRQFADVVRSQAPLRRVTGAAVEAMVGRRDWIGKRRRKLPLTVATIAEMTETVEAFQLRRLDDHLLRNPDLGLNDVWRVLRAMGLTDRHVGLVRARLADAPVSASTAAPEVSRNYLVEVGGSLSRPTNSRAGFVVTTD